MPKGPVTAHDGKQTHRYLMHFPAHPARTGDPHYVDFNHFHRKTRDTARCYIGERIGFNECRDAKGNPAFVDVDGKQIGLELHHAHIEFSLQNGVSLDALKVDYPGIENPDEVGAWVESATNFRWLCLTPNAPVLMADGSTRDIQDVRPGDWVIGGHGHPDIVTATSRKRYRGEIVHIGPTSLTPSHRVSTNAGWVPIGNVANQISVFGSDVVRLGCIQDEVGWSIVRPDPVDVMDSFGWQQWPTDHLGHHQTMLHNTSFPIPNSQISSWCQPGGAISYVPFRQIVQGFHAASVAAVAIRSGAPVRSRHKGVATSVALQDGRLGWLAIDKPVRSFFTGWVHDISIAHSHSFVSGGIVVHNCAWHHRGASGAHTASHADWEASQYIPTLITKVEE